jgi:hypothetical protein
MSAPFLLDTNSYFLFFQRPKSPSYLRLAQKLKVGSEISFYIAEITSMEIHSVVGKYRRGSPSQHQQCGRKIVAGNKTANCSNIWISAGIMKAKVFRDIQKMIFDREARNGQIQATILELERVSMEKARELLLKYADRYSLGSHDALIGGSLIVARKVKGMDLTLVTSDKGLKAVLKDETIPFYTR